MTKSGAESIDTIPGWAHRTGLLELSKGVPPDNAMGVADRSYLSERIARYCWAYDERQIEQLSACFTEDAVWEGDVLGEIKIGPFAGRKAIVKWLSEFWPHQHDQRRHMILNTIVEERDANTATTMSYLLLMSADGKSAKLETTGFYRVDLRREETDWHIARLTAGFDAPFWPVDITRMSASGKARHGIDVGTDAQNGS